MVRRGGERGISFAPSPYCLSVPMQVIFTHSIDGALTTLYPGVTLNETEEQLNETEGQLNETEGLLNETEGQLNETEDQLNKTDDQPETQVPVQP